MSDSLEPCSRLIGLEEACLYHDAGEYGFFSLLWQENSPVGSKLPCQGARSRLKVKGSYPLWEMPRIIENLDPRRDTWISQAEFIRPNRRVVNLLRISLCFVDLDTYKTAWEGCPSDTIAARLLGFCEDEDIPSPSLILFSGRGLQVKWLFERPLPRAALPRWNAVQRHLGDRLVLHQSWIDGALVRDSTPMCA